MPVIYRSENTGKAIFALILALVALTIGAIVWFQPVEARDRNPETIVVQPAPVAR
jgi:hypothetical protein